MSKLGPILEILRVTKSFRSGSRNIRVLRGIDTRLEKGGSMSIRGTSGCGKTTLLNLVAGLETPDHGQVLWGGQDIHALTPGTLAKSRTAYIGMVFQAYYLIPELTAYENVIMASRIRGRIGAEHHQRARELFERIELSERLHSLPGQLSGGERQRVALARALMNRPELILADEPTGNLDEYTAKSVIELLFEICREEQAGLILVTHNADYAARADQQLILHNGRLKNSGPKKH